MSPQFIPEQRLPIAGGAFASQRYVSEPPNESCPSEGFSLAAMSCALAGQDRATGSTSSKEAPATSERPQRHLARQLPSRSLRAPSSSAPSWTNNHRRTRVPGCSMMLAGCIQHSCYKGCIGRGSAGRDRRSDRIDHHSAQIRLGRNDRARIARRLHDGSVHRRARV